MSLFKAKGTVLLSLQPRVEAAYSLVFLSFGIGLPCLVACC